MNKLKILPHLVISSAFLAGGVRYGDLYLFHVLSLIYVAYLCLNIKSVFKIISPKLFDPVILFFALYLLYPLFYYFYSHEEISLVRFIFNGFGFLIMIAAIQVASEGTSSLKKLFIGMSGIYVLHLIVSSVESFGVFRWPISSLSKYNQLFGIDFFKANYFDYGVLASPFSVRPTSFYWSINTAALVSLLGVPFLCLFFRSKVRYLLLGLVSMVILASGSRWIIGLLLVCLVLCFSISAYQKRHKEIIAMLASVGIGAAIFMTCIMTSWHSERIFLGSHFLGDVVEVVEHGGQNPGQVAALKSEKMDDSVKTRGEMFYACLDLLKKNPIFGLGPGILSLKTDFYDMGVPHFYWLEIMVEYGVVVFALYVLAMAIMLKRAIYNNSANLSFTYSVILSFILFVPGVIVLGTANYFLPKWVMFAQAYIIGTLSDVHT